jgi:hypothetical protein
LNPNFKAVDGNEDSSCAWVNEGRDWWVNLGRVFTSKKKPGQLKLSGPAFALAMRVAQKMRRLMLKTAGETRLA